MTTLTEVKQFIADAQETFDLLDSIKDKISDGDYLKICNMMQKLVVKVKGNNDITDISERASAQHAEASASASIARVAALSCSLPQQQIGQCQYLMCPGCRVTVEKVDGHDTITCLCGAVFKFTPTITTINDEVPTGVLIGRDRPDTNPNPNPRLSSYNPPLSYNPTLCNVIMATNGKICHSHGHTNGKCGVHKRDKFIRLTQEEYNRIVRGLRD